MEGMHSMSHLMFNQVEQIADVKTCNIDNTEQRYYKVQWKCTWEPAIVLEKFCGKIIADFEKGPSSFRTQAETVGKKKQYNLAEGNCRTNITENSVDVIEEYEETEQFEYACNLFSSSNSFKESQLQRDNIEKPVEQSEMPSDRFNNELNETCSTNKVENVINESLSSTNNKVNNKLNLHNFDIKTEPDNEVFPNINIQSGSDNTSFNHAITADESSTTNKDQSNELLVPPNSTDFITGSYHNFSSDVILINDTASSSYTKRNRRNQLLKNCLKCHICSYSYPGRSHFKRHMRKHTGEKPFKCSLCSYSASQKYNLKIHMGKHTGDYRFKCDWCPYSTNVHTSLKRHLMTHTGEKLFKCDQCDYGTIEKSNLNKHLLVHHR